MKKYTIVLALTTLGFGANAQMPSHFWSKSADGGALAKGLCITSDHLGNVYTAGVFGSTSDFDPSAGVSNLASFGSDDIFIVKTSLEGNFIWAKNIGGTQADLPNDITVDHSGNVYLTGDFSGTADFNTEAGVTNLISAGGTDAFVVKLNPLGELIWAKNVGGTGNDSGQGVDIDHFNDDVYVIGYYTGTTDFDPGAGIENFTSNGSTDIFMLKLSSAGDYLTAQSYGGVGADRGRAIAVAASTGDQFLTGIFGSSTDFNPGPAVEQIEGSNDVFVLKLDVNNAFVFVKKMGGIAADEGRSIDFDDNGFIYVHGSFISTCNFNTSGGTTNVTSNGSDDVFVVQLAINGDLNWVKTFGSTGTEDFMNMSVTPAGDIYLVGEMDGNMDANPDLGIVNLLTKTGAEDAYIISLRTTGDFNWATSYGASNPSAYTRGYGIHVDEMDNVYTTGSFYATVDFDPTSGVVPLIANSGSDIWYQKLGTETNTISEQSSISYLSVSPNPSNRIFSLTSEKEMINAEIIITDFSGKEIQRFDAANLQNALIDLEKNSAGIYFISVKSGRFSEVVKVVKN